MRKANPKQTSRRFETVIVPIDFSKTSIEALRYAKDLVHEFGARIVLVHVVEKAPFMAGVETNPLVLSEKEIVAKAKTELRLVADQELEGIPAETLVRTGKAFNEINQVAAELKADIIVI